MRVLLLILQFPPDVNSTGVLLSQVCEGLVARGHHVSVITTFPHYEHFRVWETYRGRLAERAKFNGMDVLRLYVHARGHKERMLDRSLSYVSFNILASVAGLMRREKYDVILCTNGGFLSGMTASVIGGLKGLPYVLNVQDLYPETPIRSGQIKDGRLIRVLRRLERHMCQNAAHISVITPYFREHVRSLGVPAHRVSVIPNFVDTAFIRPLPKDNAFARQYGLADRFVVTHAGNVGYAYDLDTMIEAAELLRDRPELQFLIVGDGVLRRGLEERVERRSLSNVRFLPFQPVALLPLVRATSDVQVALSRPGASGHSMPSKVYEIMASGRPLLASAEHGSDLWRLVCETGAGMVIDPGDARALVGALIELWTKPRMREHMGHLGRAEAERNYSLAAIVDAYEELLARVAGKAGRVDAQGPARLAAGART